VSRKDNWYTAREARLKPIPGGLSDLPNHVMNTASRKTNRSTATLLNFLLLLSGCESKFEQANNQVSEQNYQISPDGSLSIRNPNGSIEIHGGNTSRLQMRVTKKARNSAQLQNIGTNVSAQPDSVSITTTFLRQKNTANSMGFGTIAYSLSVPATLKLHRVDLDEGKLFIDGMRGAETRASVVDGGLVVRNCFGNTHLTVANGALGLFYDRFEGPPFSVKAQITSGNARIRLARGGSFHVRAETMTGNITNAFANPAEVNRTGGGKVDLSVGKPQGAEITLRATSGDIQIAEAESVAK
jgi:hypothetical protein